MQKEIIIKDNQYMAEIVLNNDNTDYCKLYLISGDMAGEIKHFKDQSNEIANLVALLSEKQQELQQIYSHLGVETFGEDIHKQAIKEIDLIKKQNKRLKDCKEAIKSRNRKLKNKNKEIADLKENLQNKEDAFVCLQEVSAKEITKAHKELENQKAFTKARVDYLEHTLEFVRELKYPYMVEYVDEGIITYNVVYQKNGFVATACFGTNYKMANDCLNKLKSKPENSGE